MDAKSVHSLPSPDMVQNGDLGMGDMKRSESCPSIAKGSRSLKVAVQVKREPFTQAAFDSTHLPRKLEATPPLKERIRSKLYCDKKRAWRLLTTYIPSINFIRFYRIKEYALIDLMAGLCVGMLHIPQGLAFGALASVKVQNSLLTSIWPVFIYCIFGTSRQVSIGTSAVICILTAAVVDKLGAAWAADKPWLLAVEGNSTKKPLLDDVPAYMDYKEGIAGGVSIVTGIWLLLMGFFKLGFITYYLSDSFFTAFTSAAAVHIGTSQLPAMLGIKVPRFAGAFKIVYTYKAIFSVIAGLNWAAFIISLIVCVVIELIKECINERFKSKMFAPVPIELFVVIFATIISHYGELPQRFGIDIVGKVPSGIPAPRIPMDAMMLAPTFIGDAFVLAILIFAHTVAMAKICAKKHNYEVDDSQELIAYGMCNFVSGFLLCIPSSVSPPRTMVANQMSSKTPQHNIYAAVVMLCVVLFIGPAFKSLPKSALAAIIFVALKGLYWQIAEFRTYWRVNKYDFVIWLFTFVFTVIFDIDLGLFVGVGVSLVTVVFQTQFARGFRLGRTPKDSALVEYKKYADAIEIRGVKIFRFQSNLYFANAEIFRSALYKKTVNPRKLLKFLKKREQKYKAECKERAKKGLPPLPRRDSLLSGEEPSTPNPSVYAFPTSDSTANLLPANSTSFLVKRKKQLKARFEEMEAGLTQGQRSKSVAGEELIGQSSPEAEFQPDDKSNLARVSSEPNISKDKKQFRARFADHQTSADQVWDSVPGDSLASSTRNSGYSSAESLDSVGPMDSYQNLHANGVVNPVFTVEEGRSNGVTPDGRPPMTRTASVLTLNFDELEVDEYGEVIVPESKLRAMRRVHHIIIDCSPMNYMDATGANVLCHIVSEYGHVNIKVFLAGICADVRRCMQQAGAMGKIPSDHIFLELNDAIAVAATKTVEALLPEDLEDFSDNEATEGSYVTRL